MELAKDPLNIELNQRLNQNMSKSSRPVDAVNYETTNYDSLEIYSPERVGPAIQKYGMTSAGSLDFTTGYDFTKSETRQAVREMIRDRKPKVIIGSPPCTMWPILQNLNDKKCDPLEWNRRLTEARVHLAICY